MGTADDWNAAYSTPAMLAYQATPQFQEYLKAHRAWETAHGEYQESALESKSNARVKLEAAAEEQSRLLDFARMAPEHKVAFGW